MSGLEALGATASIIQLVSLAHKVVQSYEKVFENQTMQRHIAKEIVKGVENLNLLIEQRPDLVEAPDLVQLITKFRHDLEQIKHKLDAAIPKKKSRLALTNHINHFKQWWGSGDIRSNLERIEKEIEGCYKRLLTGGVVQIKLDVHEMQRTINSLEKRVQDLVVVLQSNPRRAEEIIGIPSMTLPQMRTALDHAKTDLADQRSPRPEKPFLLQKVELLAKALANHAGKTSLPIKFDHEYRGQSPSAAEANSHDDRLMSNVRRVSLGGSADEDEEDALSETLRIIRALRDGGSGMTATELGDSLRRLGQALGSLGWRQQGLTVTEWEVEIYRKLSQDYPLTFEPKLSVSLNYLSRCLRDLARENEALVAIEEAVSLSRNICKNNPIYRADLAMSLSTLSGRLAAVGHSEDALLAIKESVVMYRQLAKERPEVFLPDLAMALNSLSNRLQAQGSLELAMAVIRESVEIRRVLAANDPALYQADLAVSLGNLSNRFANSDMNLEALEAINESSAIRRLLTAQRPEVFQEDLASSLNNLSVCLEVLGRQSDALKAIREAQVLYRNLWQDFPSAFQVGYSMTLYNLSSQLFGKGKVTEALEFAVESVELRLAPSHDRPAVFLPKLVNSLNLLCDIIIHILCWQFGSQQKVQFPYKYEREEKLIQQAVALYQDLGRRHPHLSLPELTTPLDLVNGNMIDNERLRNTVLSVMKARVPPSPAPSEASGRRSLRRKASSRSIYSRGSSRSVRSRGSSRSIRRRRSNIGQFISERSSRS